MAMCRYSLPGETDFQYPFGLTCARITHIGRTLLYGDGDVEGGDGYRACQAMENSCTMWAGPGAAATAAGGGGGAVCVLQEGCVKACRNPRWGSSCASRVGLQAQVFPRREACGDQEMGVVRVRLRGAHA